jgi:acyl-coenzyme A synthetase/AMP-(fatty) acid ligase
MQTQANDLSLAGAPDLAAPEIACPDLVWIDERPVPIDFGGPVTTPFESLAGFEGEGPPLARMLWRSIDRYPDKVAVFDGEVSLTYAQLGDRANGVTRRVIDAVAPAGVVASVTHNGAAAVAILMGAIFSGRTLAPIDAGHPIERQAAIFEDCGARAVIVVKGDDVDLSFVDAALTVIEVDISLPTGAPRQHSDLVGTIPHMARFTSGSTGRPRGLAHIFSEAAVEQFIARFHVHRDDVFVSLASMSQTGVADLLAFAAGATLRVVDVRRLGIARALAAIEEARVTVLSFVPSVLRSLMGLPGIERVLARLRVLDLHGETTLASDIGLFRSKLPPGCHISITYGSTESGPVLSWFVRDEAIEGAVVPIGYLVPGKSVALLNEVGGTCAPGEVGELVVRGATALGGWRGGRLRREPFLADPADPAVRIHLTGDLVRRRPDGLFEFRGRRDRQVKIRGLWADLGEVEAALLARDDIAEAVVIVQAVDGESDTLAAFVTPADQTCPPDLVALRRAVVAATAEHMAPAEIRVLGSIPRLANHKPDLVRLGRMLREEPAGASDA